MARPVVVFAPHPDDETLACGGTIAARVRDGRDVYVVFMTDGVRSHSGAPGAVDGPPPDELARVRRREATRAAAVLGVPRKNLIFLGLESAALVREGEEARARVRRILSDLAPGEVYFPDAADSHRTHRGTNEVVEACLRGLRFAGTVRRYVIWPDEEGNRAGAGEPIEVDVSDTLALKRKAMKEYRSQVSPFSKHKRRAVLSPTFLEHFETDREMFYE
jgi:LmbE family N-acetylglucosaminyl deacetylase